MTNPGRVGMLCGERAFRVVSGQDGDTDGRNGMTAETKTDAVKVKSPAAKIALAILGIVQVTFAFLAFWDLYHRKPEAVLGPKPVWVPVILVNWIGPAVYFLFGPKR